MHYEMFYFIIKLSYLIKKRFAFKMLSTKIDNVLKFKNMYKFYLYGL